MVFGKSLGIIISARSGLLLVMILAMSGLFQGCQKKDQKSSVLEETVSLINRGKGLYDSGKFAESIEYFVKSREAIPSDIGLVLNHANAELAAGNIENARNILDQALSMKKDSAAAHYLMGLVHKKNENFTEALKSFQTSEQIEPNSSDFAKLNNLTYQLGMTHFALENWEDAIEKLYDLSSYDESHPAVWYNIGQALIRAERTDEAQIAMETHQQQVAIKGTSQTPERELEICRHTEIYVPFVLSAPDPEGIPVTFNEVTDDYFNSLDGSFSGPIAILDFNHTGTNSIWAIEDGKRFRLLKNNPGGLAPSQYAFDLQSGDDIREIKIGDIQNSGYDDVLALGNNRIYAFNMMTNGLFREQSEFAQLDNKSGDSIHLADINYTGHLDIILTQLDGGATNLLTLENGGNFFFFDVTSTSSVPHQIEGIAGIHTEDWNQDDMLDLVVMKKSSPVEIHLRQRGSGFNLLTNEIPFPVASNLTTSDLDNDLRPDLVTLTSTGITVIYQTGEKVEVTSDSAPGLSLNRVAAFDFDNDGWKDLLAWGDQIEIWRNTGPSGFISHTKKLFPGGWSHGKIRDIHIADMDNDGDSDLVIDSEDDGIHILSNQGGSANRMIKIRLDGTRSNRSGLGMQIELTAGNWRTLHTVHSLPIEIGVGDRESLDSMSVRWSDAADGEMGIAVNPQVTWQVTELRVATGSCPYLYAWDGEKFAFITDLLGGAPLGLPARKGSYIPADPVEYVKIGDESFFKPKDGSYVLQVTEELREVLYLDEARLTVVDHPVGTEVFSTTKLVAGPPPEHKVIGVRSHGNGFLRAVRSDGTDVSNALRSTDLAMVSPVALRPPQYRGLAEPWHIDLQIPDIDQFKNPVLVLNGWLQFGGGMANISGSLRSDFPFPFPVLEAADDSGKWKKVDIHLGAPIGKTKTIVADLTSRLPENTTRLRIRTAFEIHWDRIELMEKVDDSRITVTHILPNEADLHWRGFSRVIRKDESQPQMGDYDDVLPFPSWTHTPEGWCTKYGDVLPLIAKTDNQLALLNGGDELTLRFGVQSVPEKQSDRVRSFFFYNTGWDKDADFHVLHGSTVAPLPWHGMDYQSYGSQPYPENLSRQWMKKWNTRWVPGFTFPRTTSNHRTQ